MSGFPGGQERRFTTEAQRTQRVVLLGRSERLAAGLSKKIDHRDTKNTKKRVEGRVPTLRSIKSIIMAAPQALATSTVRVLEVGHASLGVLGVLVVNLLAQAVPEADLGKKIHHRDTKNTKKRIVAQRPMPRSGEPVIMAAPQASLTSTVQVVERAHGFLCVLCASVVNLLSSLAGSAFTRPEAARG